MRKWLVAVLLAALLLLLGAYSFRNKLLSAALPLLLRQADVQVQLLERLDADWDGLTIERLELAVGPDQAPQRLEKISLEYRLPNITPVRLGIAHANLQIPGGQGDGPPPSFSALLSGLLELPLDSIWIDKLVISRPEHPLLPQPIEARLQRTDAGISLRLRDSETLLALGVEQPEQDRFHAKLELTEQDSSVGALELSIATGEQLMIEGLGQLDLQPLMRLLAPLALQPEAIHSIHGQPSLNISAILPDLATSPLPLTASVLFLEGSNIRLTTTAGETAAVLAMDFTKGLSLRVSPGSNGQYRMRASAASASFTLQEDTHSLRGGGLMRDFACDFPITETCRLTLNAQFEATELNLGEATPVQLRQASTKLEARMEIKEQDLVMILSPGDLLRVASVRRANTEITDMVVSTELPMTLEYRMNDGQLTLEAERLALQLPRVSVPELNIATWALVEELTLTLGPGNILRGSSRVSAPGINLQRPAGWLPALAVSADLDFDGRKLDVDAGLGSALQGELFSMSAVYLTDTAQLTGRLASNDINFNATDKRLSGYFANWPYDWDILRGEIALNTRFVWPGNTQTPTLGARIRSEWSGVSGNYADTVFTELNASAVADYAFPDKLVTPDNASLTLGRLDVGVPVEDITATFRINTRRQELYLPSLQARLFGGRLWTDNARFRANRASNRMDIGVDGLQLAQLLEHTGYEAIQATGYLSGLLPLDIAAGGVTMQHGMLAARAPGGVLRYQAELATNSNAALSRVSEVLSNYHYSIFQVEADYRENGDLELAMQLRGLNPDMDNATPIHLNLNVTDNIPMLLKSLQSGRNIADILSKRIGAE